MTRQHRYPPIWVGFLASIASVIVSAWVGVLDGLALAMVYVMVAVMVDHLRRTRARRSATARTYERTLAGHTPRLVDYAYQQMLAERKPLPEGFDYNGRD